ncbi:hypothetical protein ATY41_06435 [Leifsonia xyli subsp. xyli]|uniref:Uncharacterized protein n=1 Tax=Leifsonia xyli subsp. xyli TaxID=59736 RepID=A0A1E2SI26_LEIXY|nr:hypothetical protein [Leifsonia xyli]ODA89350.1 hypothetical protein ATY41_06435 [Leifsonia xyli subsp. xyli]
MLRNVIWRSLTRPREGSRAFIRNGVETFRHNLGFISANRDDGLTHRNIDVISLVCKRQRRQRVTFIECAIDVIEWLAYIPLQEDGHLWPCLGLEMVPRFIAKIGFATTGLESTDQFVELCIRSGIKNDKDRNISRPFHFGGE